METKEELNKIKHRESTKKYYENNKEYYKNYYKEYRKRNKQKSYSTIYKKRLDMILEYISKNRLEIELDIIEQIAMGDFDEK